jgi:dihydroorotate dehydrogenase (fumarate)
MKNTTTHYAGLELKNPIIISSSGLTNSAKKNKRLEEAGAAAIVLKSLFEEQILLEAEQIDHDFGHTEGTDYFLAYFKANRIANYLDLIKKSKATCNIPIIASISCSQASSWTSFAKEIEKAGADALEVNVLALQTNENTNYGDFEKRHIEILKALKKVVNIPITMKLGKNITNPVALVKLLHEHGAAGVVLFNRFYQPDIDIEKMVQISGNVFSHASDLGDSLRWTGIISSKVETDLAISGGITTPEDVVKGILAGANVIELCSVLYEKGGEYVKILLQFLEEWMRKKEFKSIEEFKGKLNLAQHQGVNTFERTQFLKYYSQRKD